MCIRDRATPIGTFLESKSSTQQLTKWPREVANTNASYHTETRLVDGTMGILIDPGSVGNLTGDDWIQAQAQQAMQNGRKPKQTKRDRPLRVSGVGTGSEYANYNTEVPCAFKQLNGTCASGTFEAPSVKGSMVPGLLGLTSLSNRHAVLDMQKNHLHFLGPGEYDLCSMLPPGTESYQLLVAPSGHLLLPCNHFKEFDRNQMTGNLTLDQAPLHLMAQASTASAAASSTQ